MLFRSDEDAPDEPASSSVQSRVRIMTIHGAKGLEAPVVFLIDSARGDTRARAHEALVEWPAQTARPTHFLLRPDRAHRDPLSESVLERAAEAARREEANLLYVAVTRARQRLYISGSLGKTRGNESNWYRQIAGAFEVDLDSLGQAQTLISRHHPGPFAATTEPVAGPPAPVDARLRQPLPLPPGQLEIAPSRQTGQQLGGVQDEDGRTRGILIHQCLEWLCREPGQIGRAHV